MRKIRVRLRLKYERERSHREVAASLGIANSTVSDYLRRASVAGMSWPLPERLDDAALEAALFRPRRRRDFAGRSRTGDGFIGSCTATRA